mmetsp:Transcript_13979/g.30403  ORF Transcript_13979/g.30403 Transcript_13979/m.30403 type:complete len:176 (-) Transcript_13979:291-818(-)
MADAAHEEHEEPDYAADAQGGSDSSDSDELPTVDPYWAAKLNISNTAEPEPAPRMLSEAELARRRERAKGKGKKGGGYGKGSYGKGSKAPPVPSGNDIGSFVEWARDPKAEDGSYRTRSRSRSARRRPRDLRSFMTWAKADKYAQQVKAEPDGDEGGPGPSAVKEEIQEEPAGER